MPWSMCICISFFKFRNFLAFLSSLPVHNVPHVGQQDNIHVFFSSHILLLKYSSRTKLK